MKIRKVHTWSVILLAFLGLGAIAGGISLITDPTGGNLGYPIGMLSESPFEDYYIPGLLLLIFIGILPVFVIFLVLFRTRHYPKWIIIQGVVLIIWMLVEIYFSIFHWFLTPLYLLVALLLILVGRRLKKSPV